MSDKKTGYRDTLNLPKTAFSMKANLTQAEPQMQKLWAKQDIYEKIRSAGTGKPLFTLHDGPPYANGDIHMGHVINKVLKDFVVKYKTMTGHDCPYVPGWDCHGLPIEIKVMTDLGENIKQMTRPEIRKRCMKYASKYVKLQSKQFQQLGIFGDFKNPYLTFKPSYEKGILEVFAQLVQKKLINRQLKPIHWSIGCETALAEAELEYADIESKSIYVNFKLKTESAPKLIDLGLLDSEATDDTNICLMIWTTTPWTLTSNLAVAVNPALEYRAVKYELKGQKFVSIIASQRVTQAMAAAGIDETKYTLSKKTVLGSRLEALRYDHPFVPENPTPKDAWFVIKADYVTTEDGTGLVHIAPGHGVEDYIAGLKYDLDIYSPVLDNGCYDDSVPQKIRGKNVLNVEPLIIDWLDEIGLLFAKSSIVHSYPHCWRSKMPVIFRATEQWFVSVDKTVDDSGTTLRQTALQSLDSVKWIPAWGQKRIQSMLESRPDWCISRQRNWGVPIPVFINSKGDTLLTNDSVSAVADYIGKNGSDSWFTDSPKQILGENFQLSKNFSFDDLQKEENIFDVWFESGCSWYSVMAQTGFDIPVDLYLEGSDQHRGWFQLSLLPALGAIGKAPFKSVLTHGFTVDERGMKQSKSLGNYVNAQDEIARYGADILRLWVASVNYQEDMRCNDELIARTTDAYRKIRNTLRYLLGNLNDFEPAANAVKYENMRQIDIWALNQLNILTKNVTDAYEKYLFHRAYNYIYNFCTIQMSSIYMDVLKDTLYCESTDSLPRRSSQTAMHKILNSLVLMIAPILVHTAEQAWAAINHKEPNADSVHLALMPQPDENLTANADTKKWDTLMNLREDVLKALEQLRQNKIINSNQQANVTIHTQDEKLISTLEDFGLDNFAALCIISQASLQRSTGPTTIDAAKSENQKCERCWNYWPSVGKDQNHPDLCKRCAAAVNTETNT